MPTPIAFTLNGKLRELELPPSRKLLWVLRHELALTGTKYGCGLGECGACTIIVDNKAQRSCTLSLGDVAGKTVLSIEGLEQNGQLHPLQTAFMAHDALQCGFCTPGMIMHAYALLLKNPDPSRDEIISGMEQNLCRCGAHPRIIEAVLTAAGQLKELSQ